MPNTIKTTFNSGELSGYMDAREDVNKYHNGASKIINATVLPHGGFVKRSGTEYIATAPSKANLIPFEFSVDDALVLEFSNLLLRFYKDQAIVNMGVGTETLTAVDGGNLVAHWLLNEEAGVTVVNADNPGTLDGTASADASTLHATGYVGSGCFDLDGQYNVTVADAAVLSFTDNTDDEPFSLVCWANVTQGGTQVLMSKWDETTGAAAMEYRLSLTGERKLQLTLGDTNVNLTSDLVSQWKLNETAAATTVVDTGGVQNGVATTTTDALTATGLTAMTPCFDFDGQYAVEVADNVAFSFGNAISDSAFSIAAWVYVVAGTTEQNILTKTDFTTGSEAREWRLYLQSNENLVFRLYDESANSYVFCQTINLSTGWHFVVATYDGDQANAPDGLTLYVDGVDATVFRSSDGAYTAMENTTTKVVIGAKYDTSGSLSDFWTDKIDNVILFDAEITQATVSALYNGGAGREVLTSTATEISAVTDDALDTGWRFITATYSAPDNGSATAANGIILYVDGVVVNSTKTNDAGYGAMQDGAGLFRIGAQESIGGAAENFWNDKIDEVSIFKDVLTPTEVASLYSLTPYSIVSPYTSAQAFQVHVTQSADVMYMAHGDVHPKKLSRLDTLDWTLVDVPFTGGPFLDENTTAASLVGFARLGGTARSGYYFPAAATGTLTASGTGNEPFNSNMVGALWAVNHTRTVDNTTSTPDNSTNAAPTLIAYPKAVKTKGDFVFDVSTFAAGDIAKLWRKEGNGGWQEFRTFTAATSYSATEDEDDVYYAFTIAAGDTVVAEFTAKNQTNQGIVRITAFTSSTVVTVEVIDPVLSNNTNDNAVTTSMWAEGAWSDYRGYPRTVVFFEDRLWWASSTNNPDTLWSSQSGLYEDMSFSVLGVDSDAITFPINDNEVSQIQWMQARQVMAVGAANKEYRFGASDPDKPTSPSDRKATPQTSEGSHTIQPKILKDSIFFFQSLGKKLGKMKFDAITENFDVEDATMLSYRLFDSTPVDMAVQRVPDSIIWTVRTDGVAPTLTYEPKEDVLGWARQIFGNLAAVETPTGIVESFAVIHGGSEDEVWASVKWTINSSTVRHIVKFKPRDFGSDIEDAFYVDSGVTYDSVTAASTMTGGTHLIGETVAVFADGVVFDDAVVSGAGEIILKLATVTTTAKVVQWGLPYTMKVRTMRYSLPQEGATVQAKIKKIKTTVIRYIRSLLGTAGQEYAGVEYLQPIGATYSTESQDTTPNNRLSQGGFSEDAYTTIVSSDPVPFTALAAIVEVDIEK